jgi:SAM-dependent methyltransferase
VQHYAIRATLQGNYLAPIRSPSRILDVGTGSGQWAFDLCEEFPDALVVGLDLTPAKPARPANFRQVLANVLSGLPFREGSFDFVHQRLLVAGVPPRAWPGVVRELMTVTRPGGWIELVETDFRTEPAGPATMRLYELICQLAARSGLDGEGQVARGLARFLREAGTESIEEGIIATPLGEWAGRVGSLGASDFRAFFARLARAIESSCQVGQAELAELLSSAMAEFEQYHTHYLLTYAYGRRPA